MSFKKDPIFFYMHNPNHFTYEIKFSSSIILSIVLGIMLYNINPLFILIVPIIPILSYVINYFNPNKIIIDSEFIVFGKAVYFYTSLKKVKIDSKSYIAWFYIDKKTYFSINLKKIPTNARKPDKIRINKIRKFNKITKKIIGKAKLIKPELLVESV